MNRIFVITIILFALCYKVSAQTDSLSVVTIGEPELSVIEPFNYIALEMQGSYEQHHAAFTTLWEESVKQFLNYDNAFFAIYFNSPANTAPADLRWEVGTKLKDDDEVASPLKKKRWENTQVVKIQCSGPLGVIEGQAYGKIFEWTAKNSYNAAGPALQRHLSRPAQNAKGEWCCKMEIWQPVAK